MIDVGRIGVAFGVMVAATSVAAAEGESIERLWPALPADHSLSLEDQITDHLTELGNMLGGHLDLLSHDMMGLRVDGRANRARLRLGGGNPRYLTFRFDSNWQFGDGKARVKARLELGLAGHLVQLQLPDMDVIPDSYRGERLVQVNVPFLERKF
jgi:hypothetical protein